MDSLAPRVVVAITGKMPMPLLMLSKLRLDVRDGLI